MKRIKRIEKHYVFTLAHRESCVMLYTFKARSDAIAHLRAMTNPKSWRIATLLVKEVTCG